MIPWIKALLKDFQKDIIFWTKIFLQETFKKIIAWLKRIWFESKLTAKLTIIELENKVDFEKELKENFKPIYKEEPHPEPGTEAAKLGGPMSLTAKWAIKNKDKS